MQYNSDITNNIFQRLQYQDLYSAAPDRIGSVQEQELVDN